MHSPDVAAALEALVAAIRTETRQQFLSALGDGAGTSKQRKARAKSTTAHAIRPKGGKRSPQELAALTSSVLAYIRRHPATRVEEIATGLGTSTKELALPINKLWDAKMLTVQGQRRGMKYSAK